MTAACQAATSLWPPPRRVERPDDAAPLALPAGASVEIALIGADAAEAAASAGEMQCAVAGLRRALTTHGLPGAPGGVAANVERQPLAAESGRPGNRGAADDAAVRCRVRVKSPGALAARGATGVTVPTDESYRLRIDRGGIAIRAATPAGLFRAAATLRQWFASNGRRTARGFEAAAVLIEDRPDFPIRGAMLDVSRNRMPRMDCLERLVDRLADWKINHLQLYMEHTYAYEGHEEVWQGASPFTADEVRSLDAFCRERFIELAPNQNSCGHFHRWLVHDRYRPLAEVPEGIDHPFSVEREPFSLCATDPQVLELLGSLYDQLLPQFTSRRLNAGLDETFDLGRGRSADACTERGRAAVYLDFLRQVHGLAKGRGRQMLFWGDIILEHPELIARIPEDAVALCWGYEADHPFADHCARLAAAGREFWVCPGTSSWNSFGGRLDNAVSNLARAAAAGKDAGASGLLVADWGDHGHLQPPAIADLPLSFGAGFAWSVAAAREAATATDRGERDLEALDVEALDVEATIERARRFVFDGDDAAARAVVELGTIDPGATRTGRGGPANGTTLFYLFRHLEDDLAHRRFAGLGIAGLQRAYARIAGIRARLADQSAEAPRHAALDWTCRMLAWCCQLGIARLSAGRREPIERLAPKVRAALADDLRRIAHDLPAVWLPTSREGGLRESRALLLGAAALLHPDAEQDGGARRAS